MDDHNIKTEIELLKQNLETTNKFFQRCDSMLEKLSGISNDISKILAVHENKLELHSEAISEVQKSLYHRQKESSASTTDLILRIENAKKDMEEQYDKLGDRLSSVEKWTWRMGGAIILGAFLFSKFDYENLAKIFG